MCQLREHLARIFFPAHCTCMNFFWHDGLVQEFFSYAYALAGYFFLKSPTPPPSEVEWSAPYKNKNNNQLLEKWQWVNLQLNSHNRHLYKYMIIMVICKENLKFHKTSLYIVSFVQDYFNDMR